MRLRDNFFFRASVPIFAQVLLFFVNYVILYLTPYLIEGSQNRMSAMVRVTIIFTLLVMGLGYDKMGFWIIGWVLYFIATSIAAVYFIDTRSVFFGLNFSSINPHLNAIGVFIIQFIVWCVVKIIKAIYRRAKHQKAG